MTGGSNEHRRDGLITRLVYSRTLLETCLSDVTTDIGTSGTEWSIGDLLAHLSEPYYQDMARRFLSEESPEFVDYDPDTEWRRSVEQAIKRIEDALSIAKSLTPDKMNRTGQMNGMALTVLDALELCASHIEEHIAQLRDEVRPRESLPPV